MKDSHRLTCSPESEDSLLPADGQDSKQSPSVRTNPTASKSSKTIGPMSQSSPTSEISTGQSTEGQLSLPEGFHVKMYRSETHREKESMGRGQGSGWKCAVLLAKRGRLSRSWKTQQTCLNGDLEEFSGTWPRSGMMRNGIAYQLPTLARPISGIGYGLWPTPETGMGQRGYQHPSKVLSGSSTHHITVNDFARAYFGIKKLPPCIPEWLMGFPESWTDLENNDSTLSATRLSPMCHMKSSDVSQN